MESYNAVLSCFKSYFIVLQLLGLFPFEIKDFQNGNLIVQFRSIKFIFTIVITSSSSVGLVLVLYYGSDFDDLYYSAIYWKFTAYISITLLLIQIVVQLFCHRKIVKIVEKLVNFNLQMMQSRMIINQPYMKLQHDCKKVPIMLISMLCVFFGYFVIQSAYTVYFGGWQYFVFVHFGLSIELLYGCFNVTQFFIFNWLATQAFVCLKLYMGTSSNGLSFEKLQNVLKLFNELCHVVNLINESLCEILIPTIAASLLSEIFTAYSWAEAHYYVYGEFVLTWQYVLNSGSWIFFHLLRQTIICYSGFMIKSIIEDLKQLVMDLVTTVNDGTLKNELRCLLFQIECGPKHVENSLFVIDWKLMLMVSISKCEFQLSC